MEVSAASPKHAPRRGGMARNILHLGLGQVTTTILTILLSATMARTLGSADFGLLYLVISVASFAYTIVDWGHGPFITRETARHPDRAGDLLGSACAVRSASALLACVAAVATTWLLGYDERTRMLSGALILAWLPQYLGLSFGWVFRGHERMDLDAALNIVLKVVTVIGSIASLALSHSLLSLMLVWCVAGCLTLAMGIYLYRRLDLPPMTATMSTVRELLRDGASILAISLAVAVEPYINANILYKMGSPEVVGWFGAAANIGGTLVAPATILGATMYPRWSKAAGDDAEFKRAFEISFRPLLLVAVLGAVGTYLFADVAVGLIYSMQKFGPAADNLRVFGAVLLLMYVDMFIGMAALASGKSGWMAASKVAAVAITTGLVFILVPFCQARYANGGLGVMYAMVLGESLMLGSAIALMRKRLDGHMIVHVGRSLIAGAATVLLFRLSPAFTPFLSIPLCVFVFAGMSWLAGAMTRSDVEMLLMSFRKPRPVPS